MGERDIRLGAEQVERHLLALERLPWGALIFDLLSAVDVRLVELGLLDLADRLSLVEERLAERAEDCDQTPIDGLGEPGGTGRLLAACPEARGELADLLASLVPALGSPAPGELAGRPLVGLDPRPPAADAGGAPLPPRARTSSLN
jgi:hypothetical protein